MKILLTNDDGYNSVGIKLLKKLLLKYGDVTIVAPEGAMSGKSISIIFGRSVRVTKVEDKVYAMEGTPADCVAFALSSLGEKFDLVVSGINDGLNISFDTLYSGTIGACLEALTYRVPAIAFSTNEGHYDLIEKYFDEVMNYIKVNNLISKEHLLNVNFPINDDCKGIKMTNVFYREENTYYKKTGDNLYYALRDIKDHECKDVDTDAYAVHNSFISISKLKKIF